AIVNSPQPIYDQEPSMVAEDDETSQDKEIDKLMALISLSFKKIYKPTNKNLRTSSNTSRANQDNSPRINRSVGYENQRIDNVAGARETVGSTTVQKSGIQCYNCKEFGHVARECQKPNRAKDTTYHREKMLLCKQEEAGIQLNAEQADWIDDTDDDVELEDQELEAHYIYMAQLQEVSPDAADSGPIFDDEPSQKVSNDDHYNVFAMESEHPEQSESVRDTYPINQDAHNVIIDSLDMSYDREDIDQNDDDNDLAKERELLASLIEKLKCEIDESKNRNKFLETSNKVLIEKLKGEIEDFKTKNKSLESSNNHFKEANNKLSETNNLLYTDYKKSETELARRNSREYASQMEIECCYNDNLALMLSPESDEVIRLEKESRPKEYYYADHMNAILDVYTELDEVTNLQCDYLELLEKCEGLETELSKSKMMSKSFEALQKHAINLEIDLQQSQLQDKGIVISELKKLIEKMKGKSVDTKFKKSLVIRQPNAFKSQRPSVLGKPTTFSNSFVRKDLSKSKSVTQDNVSNDFSKPVTEQTLPSNKKSILKNTNVLALGIPQLKSNPMGDRVMRNNSQGKNQEVEDQCKSVKFSKNKTSVTLTDYGFHFDKIPMYCDSKAAITISCNPVQHLHTKHIDVRYHFIKEKVEKGIVELFFVGTEYQLADLFTKALPEERFKYLVRRLGMRCLTPAELEALANESA
nr:ribonuclease H [Tanacetum cinerariifolium]